MAPLLNKALGSHIATMGNSALAITQWVDKKEINVSLK